MSKILLILLTYLNISPVYKYIIAHFYGIFIVADFFSFYPIRESNLNIYYGAFIIEFE